MKSERLTIGKFVVSVLFVALAAGVGVKAGNLDGRKIDAGWKFRLNPHTAVTATDFDDSTWESVDLPHDWSTAFDFTPEARSGNDGGYLPTGKGAYRITLPAGTFSAGKRHRIYFEGAYMDSKVYVNGDSAGGHPYGYSSYFIDITPYVNPDLPTTVAVTVDNSKQKNSRWFTGSGIYRHVWLSESPLAVEIEPWSLTIATGKPDKRGVVEVSVGVAAINYANEAATFDVEASVGDAVAKRRIKIQANDTLRLTIPVKVADARLWSPDSPNLYSLKVRLSKSGSDIADSISARIGLRTTEYSADRGFLLNGVATTLNGACVHHDNGILGAASYDDAEIRKVKLLKKAGFNAVRTSHNPPSPAFLAACDSIGLLVIDEAFDGWEEAKTPHDYSELIDEWWQRDLDALVKRDRWHPSVVAWSIGNEILERKSARAVELAGMFASHCRSLDPWQRPVTQALAAWDSDWEIYDNLAAQHDIIGYNYMIHKAQSDHERVPQRVIWQTESYPRDVFANWIQVQDYPYVVGDFVWTGIDYIGESGIGRHYYDGQVPGEHYDRDLWPWHGSECGDIDIIGQRKPVSHYRDILHNALKGSMPAVYVSVREPDGYRGNVKETLWGTWPTEESWNWHGWEGKPIEVEVVSTLPEVELLLNDSVAGRSATDRSNGFRAVFTVPYAAGRITAIGFAADGTRYPGNVVATADEPVAIKLDVEKPGAGELVYVTATLVDANGTTVPDADVALKFEALGDAKFLAAGSSDMTDATSYQRPERTTHRGRALGIFKLPETPSGESGVRVTSTTLPAVEAKF